MLSNETKDEIRSRLKAISEAMPAFRSRQGQRVMIAEVAKTLSRCPARAEDGTHATPTPGESVLCVHGGTGIGKSLAYFLPGIILAHQKGKKLVISSSTVALQEQLTGRDLPFFLKASGILASVELAKGRTRYLCEYRLLQAIEDMGQTSMFGREQRARSEESSDKIRETIGQLATDYAEGRWNGDRDLRPSMDDAIWKMLTTDRHGCLSRNCPRYRTCAQMAARQRLKSADIIVTNHDLLLSDLVMGSRILPKPSEAFYMLDEAHHLPDKAVAAFASSHLVGGERRSMEKIGALTGPLVQAIGAAFESQAERIEDLADRVQDDLNNAFNFFASLSQLKPTQTAPRPTLEFEMSCIPEEFFSMGENIRAGTADLMALLKEAAELLGTLMGTDKGQKAIYEKLASDTGFYIGRLEEVHETWKLFLEQPDPELPPIAKWIEAVTLKHGVDYKMCASPVLASGLLRSLLWEKAAGATLASATMTTLGTFDDFLRRSGLSAYKNVTCVELPSPFDYASQGTLEIAKMKSSPKNFEAHTEEVTERVRGLLEGTSAEGLLVLFTSRRQMEAVAKSLPEALRAKVQVQGERSKQAIIAEHIRRVDRGEFSAIFGLDSFSEGVDLAGKYCTHVVITKLPFAVPDTPVLRALSGWIERRGGNPFMEISVPDAGRKLEQGVGRLIRTESDRGQVTVLDPRLWTQKFGRQILAGLPPFRVIAMGKEVNL